MFIDRTILLCILGLLRFNNSYIDILEGRIIHHKENGVFLAKGAASCLRFFNRIAIFSSPFSQKHTFLPFYFKLYLTHLNLINVIQ